ncbi:MAG: hypothetical protein Q4C75_05605, partial [Bergeyella zoohelcum]|nr:hypothetical protein [Bergeyella zoohelcum]
MLYIFVVFLVLIPVFCGIGKISEFFLGKLWNGVSGVISLGVMSVSLVWTLLAFFIPLNIYLEITTIIIGV